MDGASASAKVTPQRILCGHCNGVLTGTCFVCTICPEFDLCQACMGANQEGVFVHSTRFDQKHPFEITQRHKSARVPEDFGNDIMVVGNNVEDALSYCTPYFPDLWLGLDRSSPLPESTRPFGSLKGRYSLPRDQNEDVSDPVVLACRRAKEAYGHLRDSQIDTSSRELHLNKAIELYQEAVEQIPTHHDWYPLTIHDYAFCRLQRFHSGRVLDDLEISIEVYEQALPGLRSCNNPRYHYCLASLPGAYYSHYKQDLDPVDLYTAIQKYGEAIKALPSRHPRLASVFQGQALAFREVFEIEHDEKYLSSAISAYDSACDNWTSADGDPGFMLDKLARWSLEISSSKSIEPTLRAESAQLAVFYARQLESRGSSTVPDCHQKEELKAECFRRCWELKAIGAHTLDEAIPCLEASLVRSQQANQFSVDLHHSLADLHSSRYQTTRNVSDLDRAIELDDLVANHPNSGEDDRLRSLSSLCSRLVVRFKHVGDTSDIDRAVLLREDLVTRNTGSPGYHSSLRELSDTLIVRFEHGGDVANIDRAIEVERQIAKLGPFTIINRIKPLHRQGDHFLSRYERTQDAGDLDEALRTFHKVFSFGKREAYPDLNLSYAATLRCQFIRTKDLSFLNRAIPLFEVGLPEEDEALIARAEYAFTLLECYFDDLGSASAVKKADLLSTRLLKLFTQDHPWRARALVGRAVYLSKSNETSRRPRPPESVQPVPHTVCILSDISVLGRDGRPYQSPSVVDLLKEAAFHDPSRILDRLAAACRWGEEARNRKDTSEMQAHVETLRLLHIAISQGHSLEKQYRDLRGNATIQAASAVAVEAAALALDQARPALAIKLLEQGRGVILRQLGHLSAELDDIRVVEPALAARFEMLSQQLKGLAVAEGDRTSSGLLDPAPRLRTAAKVVRRKRDPALPMAVSALKTLSRELNDSPDSGNEKSSRDEKPPNNGHHALSHYREVSSEWMEVVEAIRKIHGFHSFLQPASFRELLWAADAGPVIVINISHHRSDALILVRHLQTPIAVSLPDATHDAVEHLADSLGARPALLSKVTAIGILREIWRIVVEPVATVLGSLVTRGSRIWWCATGAASRLPLHAAGPYKPGNNGMFEMFVSSYTPSLGALIRARATSTHTIPSDGRKQRQKILAVGQPNTPGQRRLLQVETELTCISKRDATAKIILGDAGTRDAVLQGISEYPWVHLICHGHHDANRPFSSSFSMHDGPLSLLNLLQRDLPHAELAVLSACHSARVNKDLPDESLHLAAGLMVAGFRSVVATMWALDDDVGPLVMDMFYQKMIPARGEPKSAADAAVALRKAVSIRDPAMKDRPRIPLMQRINFVHYGI